MALLHTLINLLVNKAVDRIFKDYTTELLFGLLMGLAEELNERVRVANFSVATPSFAASPRSAFKKKNLFVPPPASLYIHSFQQSLAELLVLPGTGELVVFQRSG